MDKNLALQKLVVFVSENYMVEVDDVPADRSLIDEGIIDSFGLVEIASFLENEFSITVVEDDFTRANFGSLLKMVDFVDAKQLAANNGR